jgi:polar amino acid transport system ATP-binding protein/sulfate transport system ATP-binding protein
VQGQVVGILGPSGIGKTQFSRILAGLQEPTSGRVLVSDLEKDPSGRTMIPVHEGLVGFVAQNYPLFMHRTVLGNLLISLEHTALSQKDRLDKARSSLATFELGSEEGKYPSQLSGGQRQRVAILRELLCSEHFIVMDEPFTGLDPIMKDVTCELINKVATLHEQNTIFVVAHDIAALTQIADHLWLFGRDRDAQGSPLPGARIKKQYDLVERGLAWKPDIASTRGFADFIVEVRREFREL